MRGGCEHGNGCKYIHENGHIFATANGAEKPKKEILCRFLRNCREGRNCKYFHPETSKSQNGNQKNWQKEMYMNIHFLTQQMKKVTEDLESMKIAQKGRKHDEENLGKMPSRDSKLC